MKQDKKRKSLNKILRLIAVLMLLVFLHVFLNFETLCYMYNTDSYELSVATVLQKTTDKFLLFFPVAEIQYTYEGNTYNERKLFIIPQMFGLTYEEGNVLEIYINKAAPNYPILRLSFLKNPFNYLILLFEIICIILIFKKSSKKTRTKTKKGKNEEEGDVIVESDF